jgi:hypothetical protein
MISWLLDMLFDWLFIGALWGSDRPTTLGLNETSKENRHGAGEADETAQDSK